MHRDGGHTVHEPGPALAPVDRAIDSELGTNEKQVGVLMVFDDNVHRFIWQVAADISPCSAIVIGPKDPGAEVV